MKTYKILLLALSLILLTACSSKYKVEVNLTPEQREELEFVVEGNLKEIKRPSKDIETRSREGFEYYLQAAQAAATALTKHTDLNAEQVVREAMAIAASVCIYTNDKLTVEML